MWGDGKQTRSFTFIDDCVEGILRITKSDFKEPLNLGSSEMVSAHFTPCNSSANSALRTCVLHEISGLRGVPTSLFEESRSALLSGLHVSCHKQTLFHKMPSLC